MATPCSSKHQHVANGECPMGHVWFLLVHTLSKNLQTTNSRKLLRRTYRPSLALPPARLWSSSTCRPDINRIQFPRSLPPPTATHTHTTLSPSRRRFAEAPPRFPCGVLKLARHHLLKKGAEPVPIYTSAFQETPTHPPPPPPPKKNEQKIMEKSEEALNPQGLGFRAQPNSCGSGFRV